MEFDVESHFSGCSDVVRQIYDDLVTAACTFGPVEEDPKKTSIHLNRKTAFAGVQTRRNYLLLTIKSDVSLDNERIFKIEKASANRWHAEVKLIDPAEVDSEVINWLKNAYRISN